MASKVILAGWEKNKDTWAREAVAIGRILWSCAGLYTEKDLGPVTEIRLYPDGDGDLTMEIHNQEPDKEEEK